MVDLGGSLAVASMGRFLTGVSTDLNGSPPPFVSETLPNELLTPCFRSELPFRQRQARRHSFRHRHLREE